MNQKFPCSICPKNVAKSHNAVWCDICNLWVHIKCNNITKYCYRKLQNDKEPWHCKKCIKNTVAFSQLSDNQINNQMLGSLITSPKLIIKENQVIFLIDKQGSVTTNEIFTPDEFHNYLKTLLPSNLYLHMNILSLSYNIDDLKSLITNCQVKPKIIGISERRLKKNLDVLSNINIKCYTFEYTTTESSIVSDIK